MEPRECKLQNPYNLSKQSAIYTFSYRFLWVKFQLEDLCNCDTDDAIRNVLVNLPHDLGETYDRFLSRVEPLQRRHYIKRLFNWIICSKRPLHANELREAIAFTVEDTHFDTSKIPNDLNRLARACGNLIIIDEDTESVQLAHYTVQQYLLDQRPNPSFFHMTRESADFEVGEVCVAYLGFTEFVSQIAVYSNDTTPNFAALEEVIGTQSIIPHTATGATLAKVLTKICVTEHAPTRIEYGNFLKVHKRKMPTVPLTTKYALLAYVIENWFYHTAAFKRPVCHRDTLKHKEARHLMLFNDLIFEKKLLFDIRPWDSVSFYSSEYPYVLHLGWSISTNHVPLARGIIQRGIIWNAQMELYFDFTAKWIFRLLEEQSIQHVPEIHLDRFNEQTQDPLCMSEDWGDWLYQRIRFASAHEEVDALEICLENWGNCEWSSLKAKFYGHLLLEAAAYGWNAVANILCSHIRNWRKELRDAVWITTESDGLKCNALELATLSGLNFTADLISSAGCVFSPQFRGRILRSYRLRDVIEDGQANKLGLLLRAFGATESSVANIEYHIYDAQHRASRDSIALSFAVQRLSEVIKQKSDPVPRPHWVWMVATAGWQEKIDLLLGAGAKPAQKDWGWLLNDAIIGDRAERLLALIGAGVPISGPNSFCYIDHESEIRNNLQARGIKTIMYLPPLSWAILNNRVEIIEILFDAGAQARERDDAGYLPIHFAILAGSLEIVKLLDNYGAWFNVRTPGFENILQFTAKYCEDGENKTAIEDFLRIQDTHDDLARFEEPTFSVVPPKRRFHRRTYSIAISPR
jgi:hypothetical protein